MKRKENPNIWTFFVLLVTDENYLKHSEKDKLFQSFNGHSERIKFKKEEISIKSFYRILWNILIEGDQSGIVMFCIFPWNVFI